MAYNKSDRFVEIVGLEGSGDQAAKPFTGGGGIGIGTQVNEGDFGFKIDPNFLNQLNPNLPPSGKHVSIVILDHFPADLMSNWLQRPQNQGEIYQYLANNLKLASNFNRVNVTGKKITIHYPTIWPDDPDLKGSDDYQNLQDFSNTQSEEISHGIFVAGIIIKLLSQLSRNNDIGLPNNVSLHLVNIMDNRLVGVVSDAARQIKAIKAQKPVDQITLVNCSIETYTPFDPNPAADPIQEAETFVGTLIRDNFNSVLSGLVNHESLIEIIGDVALRTLSPRQLSELLEIINFLDNDENFQIIAAAGNRNKATVPDPDPNNQPMPVYPALLHTTIAAGSITPTDSYSLFTNRPYLYNNGNLKLGLYLLGQDIVGPYIADNFNDAAKTQNSTGFGTWSGTSFSSAILTALIGHLCSKGLTIEDAKKKLKSLANSELKITGIQPKPVRVNP